MHADGTIIWYLGYNMLPPDETFSDLIASRVSRLDLYEYDKSTMQKDQSSLVPPGIFWEGAGNEADKSALIK